eukprot:TRINITY_DN6919_c0_g1_i2.p2 TRINITY_DN6919_c0_g1~~TRINITY_DN6919_c0_g1_i2.p2  ORF type:complete len:141 (+),score=17.92 TRINITY_DN6919_c0_g1_i2:57-479(+)
MSHSSAKPAKPTAAYHVEVWIKTTLMGIFCKRGAHVADLLSGSCSLSGNVDYSRYAVHSLASLAVIDDSAEYIAFCKTRLAQTSLPQSIVTFLQLELDRVGLCSFADSLQLLMSSSSFTHIETISHITSLRMHPILKKKS